jgi:hypothetical protein
MRAHLLKMENARGLSLILNMKVKHKKKNTISWISGSTSTKIQLQNYLVSGRDTETGYKNKKTC